VTHYHGSFGLKQPTDRMADKSATQMINKLINQ